MSRALIVAALLFVAASLGALVLLERGDEADALVTQPAPPPEPDVSLAPAEPPEPLVPDPLPPPVLLPPPVVQNPPEFRNLPDFPSSAQRAFHRQVEPLIPVLERRVEQCVADQRVPTPGLRTIRVRLTSVAGDGGALQCQRELTDTSALDLYVHACIEDVVEELECPPPEPGSSGAAVEASLAVGEAG